MENVETQLLAEFTLGSRSWRTVFVARKDPAPEGSICSHPECSIAAAAPGASQEGEGCRIGFVKLTKIRSLDDGSHRDLHAPEAMEVKRHLHAVLNDATSPVYLCADCYPHRLHDILNKPA